MVNETANMSAWPAWALIAYALIAAIVAITLTFTVLVNDDCGPLVAIALGRGVDVRRRS